MANIEFADVIQRIGNMNKAELDAVFNAYKLRHKSLRTETALVNQATLTPGTRVVIQPGLSCGACEFCRAGQQSLCVSYRILGEHLSGTFAELVSVPAASVYPAPAGLTDEQAAAFDALKSMIRSLRDRPSGA